LDHPATQVSAGAGFRGRKNFKVGFLNIEGIAHRARGGAAQEGGTGVLTEGGEADPGGRGVGEPEAGAQEVGVGRRASAELAFVAKFDARTHFEGDLELRAGGLFDGFGEVLAGIGGPHGQDGQPGQEGEGKRG